MGPDSPRSSFDSPLPKVFLRTLLFSTSKRGRVVESMQVALSRNETHQNFNIWVYGNEKLVRGSGLFVGETGFARLLGDQRQTKLFSQTLDVTGEFAESLAKPGTGLYFDWGPDSSRYLPHVEDRPPSPDPEDFLKMFSSLHTAKPAE